MSVGPVSHIPRRALPWRAPELTECGKPLTDFPVERLTSVEAVQALVRDVGAQRASFGVCMTCCSARDALARRRYSRADEGVVEALARECVAVQHAAPPLSMQYARLDERDRERAERSSDGWDRKQRLVGELEAIAALVEAHRDEFDGYLSGRAEAASLSERRASKRRRSGGAR